MKRNFAVVLLLMVFLAVACGELFPVKIGDITKNPRDYAGREVTVSGEVVDVFSFFVIKYFVIRDATGEITVVTNRPVPGKGRKLKVTGTVKEAFSIGSRSLLVIVEKEE